MEQSAAAESKSNGRNTFGTFQGVFLPSILTVFGVIMYLRMGWVAGHVGLVGTIFIITASSVITFITALSMASIATNMKVGIGGAYYMVSRSLGVEVGAAIGLSLYGAKAIGIAFYIAGFTEGVIGVFPHAPPVLVAVGSLVFVTLLAFISAGVALKAAFAILLIIIGSLISFFAGSYVPAGEVAHAASVSSVPFWAVFAVFFPAVTGIEAGLSMSGDLKDPARSIPRGTIAAVLVGFIVYLVIGIWLVERVPNRVLIDNTLIFLDVARLRWIVIAGIWGASLSSALGSILGAPRNLQALARDKTVPAFFGKGHGEQDTPRIATAFSFLIALVAVLWGNLDTIAPVLTMFFLTTYGSINLVAGLEGLIGNPSWRPSFRTPWIVSFIGAGLCLVAMFMINPGATFIAIFVVGMLYYVTARRRLGTRWDDIRRSIHLSMARFSIYRLARHRQDARTWRPNILVLAGAPTKRFYLMELADAITHGKGFLTVASILQGEQIDPEKIASMEETIQHWLEERDVPALVEVTGAVDFVSGVKGLITSYGIGPLVPNTILLGESEDAEKFDDFARIVQFIYRARRNLVLVREGQIEAPRQRRHHIACWWGGKRQNAGLMLTLGYLLQTSPECRGSRLTIRTIVRDEQERESTREEIAGFLKEARLIAEPDIIIHPYETSPLPTTIREASKDADLVFIGMRPPGEDETVESYADYYAQLMARTAGFPPMAIVLAAEDLKFQDIFV